MEFTHFDKNGNAVMVDVTEKSDTVRDSDIHHFRNSQDASCLSD